MKTPKTKAQGLYLKKTNNRWKWMAGATAATAAGIGSSQGTTITINLGYSLGYTGGDLNPDLTGDGHPDLTIANFTYGFYFFGVTLNGVQAGGFSYNEPPRIGGRMDLGSQHGTIYYNSSNGIHYGAPLTGSIPVFFKDLHINGGAPTRGSLQVTVYPLYMFVDGFTYNTPVKLSGSTVPDQASSLALLAMGASGILALRRWKAAQGRS